ncbi:MAG: tetratricopeptide repeat protein [Bacilli bacterium]|nr:tetratricopeptide repeat protein [Bacilli bacterium]
MRIGRLIFLIITIIGISAAMALSIVYDSFILSLFIIFLLIMSNYFLRNIDRRKTQNIILEYTTSCSPNLYMDNLRKYRRGCILSKKQKKIYDLYDCIGYLDLGEFDNALEILLEIDKSEVKFDDVTNVLLMKNWCEYFYYNNLDVKLKASLLRLKSFITDSKDISVKKGSSLIYHTLEAKYYILSGDNLDKARKLYTDAVNLTPTKLNIARAMYNLAIIDIKEKKYNEAVDKLKRVSEMCDELYVVRRAKELLLDYNNKMNN